MSYANLATCAISSLPVQMVEDMLEKLNDDIIVENRFGHFVVRSETVIQFPQGLIGFADLREFALLQIPGTAADNKFRLLQSLDDANLTFIVMPTTAGDAKVSKEDVEMLCREHAIARDYLLLMHIATLREVDGAVQMTLNLRAPVVLNTATAQAQQVVLTSQDYPLQLAIKAG
jgi:flagellar assembly factor FliW